MRRHLSLPFVTNSSARLPLPVAARITREVDLVLAMPDPVVVLGPHVVFDGSDQVAGLRPCAPHGRLRAPSAPSNAMHARAADAGSGTSACAAT